VFACAQALERNPDAARAIGAAGFDICSHGWRWIDHTQLSEEEEREHIARAVASLQASTGQRPAGWYCRYGPSLNTRRLLVEEGGFLYDSDCYNDELPYWVQVDGRSHLVVPYSMTTNDGKLAGSLHTRAWLDFVLDGFDLLRREGRARPKMLSVGLHNRIIGHPSRAAVLERLLDQVASAPDVWVTRRSEIAEHWRSTHPAP
jgi:peptidoglycan/xylan/chitin deacetylase (PgdA/CDA1 family)